MARPRKNAKVNRSKVGGYEYFELWYAGLRAPVMFFNVDDLRFNLMTLVRIGMTAADLKIIGYAGNVSPTAISLASLDVKNVTSLATTVTPAIDVETHIGGRKPAARATGNATTAHA